MNRHLLFGGAALVVLALVIYRIGARDDSAAGPTAEGAVLAQVEVPELTGDARIGAKVFDAKCASCHGRIAAGRDGAGPPLVHKVYEPSHHADGAFLVAARNGVRAHHWPFGNMPPVADITNAEILAVVEYVRALQVANGIE